MKRNIKKTILALTLSSAMILNAGISVLATGTDEGTVTVTTTQDTTTDANGNTTTTTVTESSALDGTYFEVKESTEVKDVDGNLIQESGSVQGSETSTTEKTDNVDELNGTFDSLEEGATASDAVGGSTTVTGDVKTGEEDKTYDQTTVTETQRTLEAEMTEVTVTEGDGSDIEVSDDIEMGLESINPTWPEKDDITIWKNQYWANYDPNGSAPDGYEYYYAGTTADSHYGVEIREDGAILDYADVTQFKLKDENGNVYSAYCVDMSTGTKGGWWYSVENLEEAGYYSAEDAEHIRAIVLNGYWGTESDTGSLTQMKKFLKEHSDELGLTADDIDQLTAGEAQAATQMAIWTFGNQIKGELELAASNCNGDDYNWVFENGEFIIDCDSNPDADTLAAWNRINKITAYLVSLSVSQEEANTTEVLDADKFISNVGLVVGEKLEDSANNADDDDTNDVYNVGLTFKLEVETTENDDLVVKVYDGNGLVVRTVRLAGDNTETGYDVITPDENGVYTISGLVLQEGEAAFDIKLEGAQYLKEGAYIYKSESRDNTTSQTFVGIASGYHAVDLALTAKFVFNVNEATTTTERIWASEYYSEYEVSGGGDNYYTDPGKDSDITVTVTEDGLVEIEEEEVPMADAPETGSFTGLWLAIAVAAAAGLAAVVLTGKKKEN